MSKVKQIDILEKMLKDDKDMKGWWCATEFTFCGVPTKQIVLFSSGLSDSEMEFIEPDELIQDFRVSDVVCHRGSYGYQEGLLEQYGLVDNDGEGDDVMGYLTAKDVYDCWKKYVLEHSAEG